MELTKGKEYSYYDARDGTRYLAHTCTNDGDEPALLTGGSLRYTIMEGGDHTKCQKKVLGAPVMGKGRG